MSATASQDYDAIVIGSGIGGLTVAAILAKLNRQRVLLLERHFKPGGFTHAFKRQQNFRWDVGLHYVGDMGEGQTARNVFDYLTDGQLHWQKMPDRFDVFEFPGFQFQVPSDPERYQATLYAYFPAEKVAIAQYLRDVRQAATAYMLPAMLRGQLPRWLYGAVTPTLRRWGRLAYLTTQEYLEQHVRSPQLRAVLAAQWGDYGLPPRQSAFGAHAAVVSHFLNGGWYPVGGAKEIARQILPAIERAGGKVLLQREVEEILLEGNRAVGVRARRKNGAETYRAPKIISDAGAYNTYLKMLPPHCAPAYRQEIAAFPKGTSAITLYLGLKESPAKLGFRGENHWLYAAWDTEGALAHDPTNPDYQPGGCFLSFPSLKDPTATGHTAEIITFARSGSFDRWHGTVWHQRGDKYDALKAHLVDRLLALVEIYYPGFSELVAYQELATPLTVEHFDGSDRGVIYGIPAIPARIDRPWIQVKTPVKNLYLTGSDAASLGIVGAMMGGVATAGVLNGPFGFFKVMAAISRAAARLRSAPPSQAEALV